MKLAVIDSGIGGLTLLKDIKTSTPVELYYICDTKNVPYGDKPQSFMFDQMCKMVDSLKKKSVENIFIACNTLTAETIEKMRSLYEMNFIGIEPFVRYPEIKKSSESYALILTRATYNSKRFKELLKKSDPNEKISVYPLEKLAMILEELKEKNFSEIESKVVEEISFLKNKYDNLILGCTHYSLIEKFLSVFLNTNIIKPNDFVLKRLYSVLGTQQGKFVSDSFYYSNDCGENWDIKQRDDFKIMMSSSF